MLACRGQIISPAAHALDRGISKHVAEIAHLRFSGTNIKIHLFRRNVFDFTLPIHTHDQINNATYTRLFCFAGILDRRAILTCLQRRI